MIQAYLFNKCFIFNLGEYMRYSKKFLVETTNNTYRKHNIRFKMEVFYQEKPFSNYVFLIFDIFGNFFSNKLIRRKKWTNFMGKKRCSITFSIFHCN